MVILNMIMRQNDDGRIIVIHSVEMKDISAYSVIGENSAHFRQECFGNEMIELLGWLK